MIVVERLSAEDRVMLWPDELWPQEIGVLGVLEGSPLLDGEGRFRIERAREVVEARLHLVPRFRQLLRIPGRGLGPPLWVDAPWFDIAAHVRVLPVPAPGDEAQLLRVTEQLRRRRLDRARPLWEMWFLPGLPEDRIGLFVKFHHAIADGIAGVATVGALLDDTPERPTEPVRRWIPARAPTATALAVDNARRHVEGLVHAVATIARPVTGLRRLRAAWPATRELVVEGGAPATSLNRTVGPDRDLAFLRGSLDVVGKIAHVYDAKVNDVLLAITAGGLRGLLVDRGEPVEDLLMPVYVPVTLRHERAQAKGNQVAQMIVRLPIGLSDPGQRLRQIAAETATRKARSRPSLGLVFRSRIVRKALLKVITREPVNVTTADVPGPQQPVYLAGARLLEVFPVLPLIGNVTLGVGALSYAGQFNVMAVGDREAVPDLDVFVSAARNELEALAAAAGLPAQEATRGEPWRPPAGPAPNARARP